MELQKTFKYGMVVQMEALPLSTIVPQMGIALTSSSTPKVLTYFKVRPYHATDSDINYKIRLIPLDREHFGDEILYTSDAERMVKDGRIELFSPLVSELIEYFATTPKEQIEKDYQEIHSMIECSEPSLIKSFLKKLSKLFKK